MNSLQEIHKLSIKCITPVNISDGTKLNAKEYLYDKTTGKVYFLNHLLWHQFIYTHKLLAAYERYMLDRREKKSLYEWLQGFRYDIKAVNGAIKSSADAEVKLSVVNEKNTVNDIVCQAKLINGEAYIPGSSIKGVIRTAIIYGLLHKNNAVKNKYWAQVSRNVNTTFVKDKDWKNLVSNLEEELLHKLILVNDKNQAVKCHNAVCSVMRGISCSDAYSDSAVSTSVLQKIDLTFDRNLQSKKNKISVFRECIAPETVFNFTINIDKTMLTEIGINSLDDILDAVNNYFKFVNDMLYSAFGNEYGNLFSETEKANIYLGGGTGFLTKTIIAALAPNMYEAATAIKMLMDKKFSKHKHRNLDKKISPRTLKATTYKNKECLMGLAVIYKNE